MSKLLQCPLCGNNFELGLNGVWSNELKLNVCDECVGVQRDEEGNAWFPYELTKIWDDGTSVTRVVSIKEKKQ